MVSDPHHQENLKDTQMNKDDMFYSQGAKNAWVHMHNKLHTRECGSLANISSIKWIFQQLLAQSGTI